MKDTTFRSAKRVQTVGVPLLVKPSTSWSQAILPHDMQSAPLKVTPDSAATPSDKPNATGWPNATGEVEARDKDSSWSTVGDKADTASGGDSDNASVNSGSVISGSSVPGLGHGDRSGQASGSAAMQGQADSSMWSDISSTTVETKIESDPTWAVSPQTSLSSSMWSSSLDNKTAGNLSKPGAQNLPNGISTSSSISNMMQGSIPSSVSGVWGESLPGEGQFSAAATTGAQKDHGSLPGSGQSNSFGSAMWQGICTLSDLDSKESETRDSGWGSQSNSSSVIGSGLSISASSGSAFNNPKSMPDNAMDQMNPASSSSSNLWASTTNTESGRGSGFDNKSENSGSGWGSPCPSPISNAGTEGWGAPEAKKAPGPGAAPAKSWGQSPTTPGWEQPERRQNSWDQQMPAAPPAAPAWGEPPKPEGSGWGGGDANRPGAPSAWGTQPDAAKPQNSQSQTQWGGSGASGPPSQWPGGSAAQPASSTSSSNQMGAWGSGNPMTAARPPQPPRPIGSQCSVPPPPVQQPPPPQQPGSWAEAAGRGLIKPSPVGTTNRQVSKEEIINQAINSADNWGKTTVRQDTSWDNIEDSPKIPRKPLGSASSTGSQEDLHWNQPNNGTAIWESVKESAPSSAAPSNAGQGNWDRSSGASGSSNEWGASNDNDGGTWNGGGGGSQQQHQQQQQQYPYPQQQQPPHQMPPPQQQQPPPMPQDSNVWQGPPNTGGMNQPPKASNMWGGNDDRPGSNSWSSGSSGSNDSKKNAWQGNPAHQSNQPVHQGNPGSSGGAKSDNVWDVNGTSLWGDPEKTETGTWSGGGAEGARRNSSSGSWESDTGGNWNNRRDDNRNQNFDHGGHGGNPAYWGNPEKPPSNWNNSSNTSNPMTPHGMMPPHIPQPITGRPPNDKGPVWGQTPATPKPRWEASPPGGSDDMMWNQAGPKPPNNGWNDAQWQQRGKTPSFSAAGGWGGADQAGEWNGMGNSRKPPQRSRMLQQLMDMGFKKEDAQNALIRSDMDLDRAITDLVASAKRPEFDPDLHRGRQLKGMGSSEDLADVPVDPNVFMPPQNTLNNAQGLLNTQVIAVKPGPSLPQHMSSHNTSINPLPPHKLPPPLKPPGQLTNQTQQMIQAQIVQQLQMAVQAGLISPQLLNQHLTPAMLVMLQQLLQLQQVYQQLVTQEQLIQQNKTLPQLHKRTQLEQIAITIAKIKQKIAQAQQALAKQGTTQQRPPGVDPNKELLKDLQDLQLKDAVTAQQTQQQLQNQQAQQVQSRLQQWKLPSPDKSDPADLNRAPGSRPVGPHSTPNLQIKQELGSQFSDPWSVLPSTNTMWPTTSTTVTTTAATSRVNTKTSTATDQKESPNEDATKSSANSANSSPTTTATCSSPHFDIAEFVPGKPWQGVIPRSVEDDPHLTPGHAALRRPISISTVNDEYVASTLGKSSSTSNLNKSPTVSDATANWNSAASSSNSTSPSVLAKSTWSGGTSAEPSQATLSAMILAGAGGTKNKRPPPGINPGLHRSASCPGGPGSWGSNWLILKSLPAQIDGSTVKNLCHKHGSLQTFLHSAQFGQAYVCYKVREDAVKAQKALNAFQLGNATIVADFVSDAEASRLQEMTSQNAVPSSAGHWPGPQPPLASGIRPAFNPPPGKPQFEQGSPMNGAANFSVGGGNMWSSSSTSSSNLWGPMEERADNMSGGLLGGGH